MRGAITSFVLLIIVVKSLSVLGTTPPESYPLVLADGVTQSVDPGLEAWLSRHSQKTSILDLDDDQFRKIAGGLGTIEQIYVYMLAGANAKRQTAALDAIDEFIDLKETEKDNLRSVTKTHVLLPFLYDEILNQDELNPEREGFALAGVKETGLGTCAEKNLVYSGLEREKLGSLSTQGLVDVVNRIESFRSTKYRLRAATQFLYALPAKRRTEIRGQLAQIADRYPRLRKQNRWLDRISEQESLKGASKEERNRIAILSLVKRRRCTTARSKFLELLKLKPGFDKTMEDARKIGSCYRRRGQKARRNFWQQIAKPMEAAHGFDGWAAAHLRLGYLFWAVDKFSEAKRVFAKVISEAERLKSGSNAAKAIFALGRIAENENDRDGAIKQFETFVSRYEGEENYDKALIALTLLHFENEDWRSALAPAKHLLGEQAKLAVDDRSTSNTVFALFWAGRLHLLLEEVEEARAMWRRAASEYYSTFYGALSHYMLERLSGKRFVLAPTRVARFRVHKLRKKFPPVERRRIRRVETLLRLGLQDKAQCEIAELAVDSKSPDQLLMKALLQHAAGDWLDAIQNYNVLPRTYRHSLAQGLERILFPRRYTEPVKNYARKLSVDPDFVFAVIRQESVFNPRAHSPAGARGLMQLMPATAKLESRRLRNSYLPAAERKRLRHSAKNKRNLFKPQTNLAIGIHHLKTLLRKYDNPVLALAAYNASPTAAKRWRTNLSSKDELAFIERIPYNETRNYVKLILRNYFYYKRWYQSPEQDLNHLEMVAGSLATLAANRQE